MNEETSGTYAPLAAGLGEATVRAHSQAITVSFWPFNLASAGCWRTASAVTSTCGYRWPMRFSASSRIHLP
jgi:hypothetical protein